MNRRHILAALAAAPFAPVPVFSASASPADLRNDIRILREALMLHPGLYRYASPVQVEGRIASLEREFLAAPDPAGRYLALSRFLATIRCGHSYANFLNQKKAVAADLFDRPTRLPFRFRWLDGRMIVTADPDRLGLTPGSEVTHVNGIAASAMLARLLPYARADGHNDAKRVSLLEVSGDDRIAYFDVFHGLLFGAGANGGHRLRVRTPGGQSRTVEVPAIGLAARRAQSTPRDPKGDRPVWDWTMRPDGVAVLTMPGWALYDSTWDWRTWLGDRLDSLGGARGLVVDLRANEGGQDCGDAILARLIDRPLREPGAERRVRFRTTPAALDPYLDTWDQSFRRLGVDAAPSVTGFLRLTGDRADDAIAPVGPRLTLPVATLIGPANSSATFQFAQAARRSGRVRLFGQPTGGNQRGINGGCFFFVRLPASGLEFDLPLIGYFPPGAPPDAGIAPDVNIAPTVRDIAGARDPALEAAAGWAVKG
ncbi:MAG: S41 family peptidase [Pseudomonadota bacterium]